MRLRSEYDREIVRLAVPALGALAAEPLYILVFALMQPLAGAVFALDGILIGAGYGPFLAASMVAAFLSCAALLLATLAEDWGIRGVWVALVVLILVRLTPMAARFRRGRWLVTGWAS